MPQPYAIDPELAEHLHTLPDLEGVDVFTARRRLAAAMASLPSPSADGVDVSEHEAPGFDGEPAVPVTVYRPELPPGRPAALLDVHGGGFFMGSSSMNHSANLVLARRLGAIVVSVEYRLAPENPFPAALHDCSAALSWISDDGPKLGIDPTRVGMHGFSAGAGLCAATALAARDLDGPPIAFQYLGSPVLDDRLTSASMRRFDDTPMWSRPLAESGWRAYLGPAGGTADCRAAPARATDLARLPPTYVSVMTFDPLRDEGIEFAQRLLAAEVPVELHLFPGTFHGSNLLHRATISRRELRERVDVLRRGLDLPER